jgi:hypothetical protein
MKFYSNTENELAGKVLFFSINSFCSRIRGSSDVARKIKSNEGKVDHCSHSEMKLRRPFS